MVKIDYKKEWKHLYSPSAKDISVVQVPALNFLALDGLGDPNTSEKYKSAVEILFSVSYALKFSTKRSESETDYSVMPLEGLWWSDNMMDFITGNKDNWKWTLLIMQPEWITPDDVAKAVEAIRKKKKSFLADELRFEKFDEGISVQITHIGPFSTERQTIETMHRFISENGYKPRGKHHEIYLSDFRKCAPEKMKTILRQPVSKREHVFVQ